MNASPPDALLTTRTDHSFGSNSSTRASFLALSVFAALAALEGLYDGGQHLVTAASTPDQQPHDQAERAPRAIAPQPPATSSITPPESLSTSQRATEAATPASQPSSFSDINGHNAQTIIAALAQQGIVKGFPDSTFRPNDAISPDHLESLLRAAFEQQETDFLQGYIHTVLQSDELSSDEKNLLIPAITSVIGDRLTAASPSAGIQKQLGESIWTAIAYQVGRDRADSPAPKLAEPSSPMTRAEAATLVYQMLHPDVARSSPADHIPASVSTSDSSLVPTTPEPGVSVAPRSTPQPINPSTRSISLDHLPYVTVAAVSPKATASPPAARSLVAQLPTPSQRLSQLPSIPSIPTAPTAPTLPSVPANTAPIPIAPTSTAPIPTSPNLPAQPPLPTAVLPVPNLPPPPGVPNSNTPQVTPIPTVSNGGSNPAELLEYWQGLCKPEGQSQTDVLSACDQVLALDPRDAQIWTTRANALYQLGRYAEAIASYNRALSITPDVSSLWVERCRAVSALGNQSDAIASCGRALELDQNWNESSRAIALYYWGVALKRSGNNEEANAMFDRALVVDPAYSLAWADKCRVLSELGQQDEAIAACDRALQANGNWGDRSPALAWQNRALALMRLGQLEEAINAYNQALAINPNDATSWTTQGVLLAKLGRYTEALTSQNWAVKVSPDYAVALVNRCTVLNKLVQYEAALADCEKALNADGQWNAEGPAQAWDQQGHALAGLGRLDDALAAANRAVGILPNYAEAWNNRSVILWRMDNYQEALASTDRAIQLKSNYSQAWFNKGRILRSLSRYDQAIAAYDQAIQADGQLSDRPTLANIWANRSAVLWQLNRYDEALSSANQAVRIAPTDAQAWYNRGVVLAALNRYDDALASYEQAIQHDPNHAYAWAGKGLALAHLNRQPEAQLAFNQALTIDPNQPVAKQQIERQTRAIAQR